MVDLKTIFLLQIIITFVSACSSDTSNNSNPAGDIIIEGSGDVTYQVTFETDWSIASHPDYYPSDAHFSLVFLTTHNSSANFWTEGESASAGIKQMAEVGGTSSLETEADILVQLASVDMYSTGNGLSNLPTSLSISFPVNSRYPLVTIVSMLAPSSDWFVCVSALDLYPNGVWVDDLTVDLYTYDAGTAGASQNVLIEKISTTPFLVANNIIPVGRLIFNKQTTP